MISPFPNTPVRPTTNVRFNEYSPSSLLRSGVSRISTRKGHELFPNFLMTFLIVTLQHFSYVHICGPLYLQEPFSSGAGSKLELVWRFSPPPYFLSSPLRLPSFSVPFLPFLSVPPLPFLFFPSSPPLPSAHPSPSLRSRSPLFLLEGLGERCKPRHFRLKF